MSPQLADPPPAETEAWKAWDDFVESAPGSGFMQTSWWARFRAGIGIECFAAIFRDEDGRVAGGALVSRHSEADGSRFYYVQDGPVLPEDGSAAEAVFTRLLAIAEEQRRLDPEPVSHLRIEPRLERLPGFVQGFRPAPPRDDYSEARNTLCVDLRPREDEILAQMKPKGRYNVGLARRRGVAVVEDASARGLADFVRIYRRTAARQGMEPKPPSYFRELMSEAGPRRAALFFSEHQGRRLAAALVVTCGRRATYFYGGSLNLRRRVMAPYLLHFEIMRRAKAAGIDWYDFWGIAPEDAPEDPWRGFSAFKRKFGGIEVRLAPTLDLVYDARAYDRYVALQPA